MVPEGIPSQFVVQAYCTTSVFDLCDPTRFCLQYMLFSPSALLSKGHVDPVPFHLWWCAAGACGLLCNDVQREGAKLSPDLASGLFCYVPLHKIWYGIEESRLRNNAGRSWGLCSNVAEMAIEIPIYVNFAKYLIFIVILVQPP